MEWHAGVASAAGAGAVRARSGDEPMRGAAEGVTDMVVQVLPGASVDEPNAAEWLRRGAPITMLQQPIVDLRTGTLLGVEALAAPSGAPGLSIADALRAARSAGRGAQVEAACIVAARALRARVPREVLVTLNVSPDVLEDEAVGAALAGDLGGVIIELTENPSRSDGLAAAVSGLRERGAAIAIDDLAAGYSGLLRVAEVWPDLIKLDRRLVAGVRDDAASCAVIEATVLVATRLGARVVAEGVEELEELRRLGELGVDSAQGFAIGRPSERIEPLDPSVVVACRDFRRLALALDPRPGAPSLMARLTAPMYTATAELARFSTQSSDSVVVAQAGAEAAVGPVSASERQSDLERLQFAVAESVRLREAITDALDMLVTVLSVDLATADLRYPAEVGLTRTNGQGLQLRSSQRADRSPAPVETEFPDRAGWLASYPALRTAVESQSMFEVRIESDDDAAAAAIGGQGQSDTGRLAERALLRGRETAGVLVYPIIVDASLHGVLELHCRAPRIFSWAEITHLRGVGQHVAALIGRLRRNPAVER